MPLETSSLHQKAVLWPFAGYDGNGDTKVGDPIEIDSRWEFRRSKVQSSDESKESIVADVWLDREVDEESLLRKGTLKSLPDPPDKRYRVVHLEDTPDIKSEEHEIVVQVSR